MQNIFDKNNIQIKILLGIAFGAALFVLYGVWEESRSGSIDVFVAERGATVFLDQKRVGITNSDDQTITLPRVSPGNHSVLVSLEGYYPWGKTVQVVKKEKIVIRSFSVKTEILPSYKKTEFTDSERKTVGALFAATGANKKIGLSGEGNVTIERDGGRIVAQWIGEDSALPSFFCDETECNATVEVINSKTGSIGTFDFFPGREDVVLFALGPSIYALELDKRGTQNFQPIYTGTNPDFAADDESSMLYIRDNGALFGVKL